MHPIAPSHRLTSVLCTLPLPPLPPHPLHPLHRMLKPLLKLPPPPPTLQVLPFLARPHVESLLPLVHLNMVQLGRALHREDRAVDVLAAVDVDQGGAAEGRFEPEAEAEVGEEAVCRVGDDLGGDFLGEGLAGGGGGEVAVDVGGDGFGHDVYGGTAGGRRRV